MGEVLRHRRSPDDHVRMPQASSTGSVEVANRQQTLETSRINQARIAARVALRVLSDIGNAIIDNPLPSVAAATVAGGYSWISNENIPVTILGIGLGVIAGKLVQEWQRGPYHV